MDLVRRRVADGVTMQRVHTVAEPWTDYVRFEITWSYPPNIAAGEDIRIITTSRPWAGPDFWMFDDRRVWVLHYAPDGALERVEDVSRSASAVAACVDRRNHALRCARPLSAPTTH